MNPKEAPEDTGTPYRKQELKIGDLCKFFGLHTKSRRSIHMSKATENWQQSKTRSHVSCLPQFLLSVEFQQGYSIVGTG